MALLNAMTGEYSNNALIFPHHPVKELRSLSLGSKQASMISISLSSRLSFSQLPEHQRTLPGAFQIIFSHGVPHHTTAISPGAQALHSVLKILLACADQWVSKFQFTLSLFLEGINQRENQGNTSKQMEYVMFTSN